MLTVGALEAGFADTPSQPRVLPAGIALGPCSTAITVWEEGGDRRLRRRQKPTLPPERPALLQSHIFYTLTQHKLGPKKQ